MLFREYLLNGGFQDQPLDMPVGAQIVHIDRSNENRVRLSVLVDETETRRETRLFKCLQRNTKIPEYPNTSLSYVGSVSLLPNMCHVFEMSAIPKAEAEAIKAIMEPAVETPAPAQIPVPAAEPAPTTAPEPAPEAKPQRSRRTPVQPAPAAPEPKPEPTAEPVQPAPAANPFN